MHNPKHVLWLSILDGPLMLLVNFPFIGTIHQQGSKFFMGVKIETS